MKICFKLAPIVAVLVAFVSFPVGDARAEEKFEPPGTKEQAAVDQANKELDRVYGDLMAKADDSKASLRDAQRAWIKWRDAEAMFIARHGGAVGGSALRVDVRGRSIEADQRAPRRAQSLFDASAKGLVSLSTTCRDVALAKADARSQRLRRDERLTRPTSLAPCCKCSSHRRRPNGYASRGGYAFLAI